MKTLNEFIKETIKNIGINYKTIAVYDMLINKVVNKTRIEVDSEDLEEALRQAGEVAVEEFVNKKIKEIRERRKHVNIFCSDTGNMFMEDIINLLEGE